MRNNSKTKIFIIILGISFTLSTISIFSITDDLGNNEGIKEIRDETNLKSLKLSGAYIESFIHIDGNWSATTSYDWCSGDGSWSNPYIIENVTIDAISSPTGSGIFINNSKNIYFIIRNCTVYNAPNGIHDAGIKLENTSNGTIINNDFSDNNYIGIFMYNDCKNNTISRNWADDNAHSGIKLENNCGNNSISENSFNNQGGGIYLKTGCDNNTIIGNTASENVIGIFIDTDCDNNNISENYLFLNSGEAILIAFAGCENNIITRNIIASEFDIIINDWGTDTTIEDNYILPNAPSLCVEIINQFFSNAEFIVTLDISSGLGFNPWIKFIQVWWNGSLVPSNSITEIGVGLYNISLTPIFVVPGQDPILLNMSIKSSNHIDKYFETFLSVRPYEIPNFIYIEIVDQVFSSIEF
jgi:parallel beta-helix repeat protein